MSECLLIISYILVSYGICNIIAFGSGPFDIFDKLRSWAFGVSDNLGQLFTCMMCLPANFGMMMSVVNWFLIPIAFTPFNIIFAGLTNFWWVAMLMDCAFTSASVWLIHTLQEYFENKTITSGERILND